MHQLIELLGRWMGFVLGPTPLQHKTGFTLQCQDCAKFYLLTWLFDAMIKCSKHLGAALPFRGSPWVKKTEHTHQRKCTQKTSLCLMPLPLCTIHARLMCRRWVCADRCCRSTQNLVRIFCFCANILAGFCVSAQNNCWFLWFCTKHVSVSLHKTNVGFWDSAQNMFLCPCTKHLLVSVILHKHVSVSLHKITRWFLWFCTRLVQ